MFSWLSFSSHHDLLEELQAVKWEKNTLKLNMHIYCQTQNVHVGHKILQILIWADSDELQGR